MAKWVESTVSYIVRQGNSNTMIRERFGAHRIEATESLEVKAEINRYLSFVLQAVRLAVFGNPGNVTEAFNDQYEYRKDAFQNRDVIRIYVDGSIVEREDASES